MQAVAQGTVGVYLRAASCALHMVFSLHQISRQYGRKSQLCQIWEENSQICVVSVVRYAKGLHTVCGHMLLGTSVPHNQSSHFCFVYSLITRWNPREYVVCYVQILCFDSIVQIDH